MTQTPKKRVQRKAPAKTAAAPPPKRKPAAKRKAPEKPAVKRKVGRPTKYKPEYCDLAIAQGKKGRTWTAIASRIGVLRETLYNWMDVHPEFLNAMKESRHHAMKWWEQTLEGQARGKYPGGSASAAIFAMKNQFPDDYKDRREHKVEAEQLVELNFMGFDGTPIDFGDDD